MVNFTLYLYPSVPRRHEISPPQCLVKWLNVVCVLRQLIVVRFQQRSYSRGYIVNCVGSRKFTVQSSAVGDVLPIQDHDTVISVN